MFLWPLRILVSQRKIHLSHHHFAGLHLYARATPYRNRFLAEIRK